MKLKYVDELFAEAENVTPREIQEVADMQVPAIPRKEDLVGILPEDLRKLAAVMIKRDNELRNLVIAEDSKPRTNNEAFELKRLTDLLVKAKFLKHRLDVLDSFFWETVSAEFNLTEDGLGINRKWEVYFVNPKCKDCGKRHPQDEPEANDPGLDRLFRALGRNSGTFFGRGGNA